MMYGKSTEKMESHLRTDKFRTISSLGDQNPFAPRNQGHISLKFHQQHGYHSPAQAKRSPMGVYRDPVREELRASIVSKKNGNLKS